MHVVLFYSVHVMYSISWLQVAGWHSFSEQNTEIVNQEAILLTVILRLRYFGFKLQRSIALANK